MDTDYTNSTDLTQGQNYKTYYDRNLNFDIGMRRQNNIINNQLNEGENLVWEIKTDYQANMTKNFFCETHQIKCGCIPVFEKSGINTPDWTHIMFGLPHPDDSPMLGDYLLTNTWTRKEFFRLVEKYLEENPDLEGRGRNIGLPYDANENFPDEKWMTYLQEKCADGTKRYSRGLLIPVNILFDRFYISGRNIKDFDIE